MVVVSSDNLKMVDVGSEGIWYSILSTVEVRLSTMRKEIKLALDFLNTGKCNGQKAFETARQFNLIRDAFSQIIPTDVVFDMNNPNLSAPWEGKLSGIVTSCGNLYTTADGKDLLYEIICILTYAYYQEVDILSCGWTPRQQ